MVPKFRDSKYLRAEALVLQSGGPFKRGTGFIGRDDKCDKVYTFGEFVPLG